MSFCNSELPAVSRVKSEARFQGPTRFAGQLQSFDPAKRTHVVNIPGN